MSGRAGTHLSVRLVFLDAEVGGCRRRELGSGGIVTDLAWFSFRIAIGAFRPVAGTSSRSYPIRSCCILRSLLVSSCIPNLLRGENAVTYHIADAEEELALCRLMLSMDRKKKMFKDESTEVLQRRSTHDG